MKLNIMDQTGHSVIEFDKTETSKAMEKFNELVKTQKHRAAVKQPDGSHKLVKDFDPNAEEMIFFPQLKGG
jgi:hypothetical protein